MIRIGLRSRRRAEKRREDHLRRIRRRKSKEDVKKR